MQFETLYILTRVLEIILNFEFLMELENILDLLPSISEIIYYYSPRKINENISTLLFKYSLSISSSGT